MERQTHAEATEPTEETGPYGFTDRFISPEILARGEPHVTRARMLVFQSAAIALISAFSMFYQVRFGASALGLVGAWMLGAALLTPFLLVRARSHVWVSGVLTGNLFLALSAANFVTAGHAVASTIFITAIPLVATLTQGVRLGAFWGVLTLAELFALALFRELDVAPLMMPNPRAAEIGSIRTSILVTMLVTTTGVLHAYFNDLASRRAIESESTLARNRASYREMLDSSPDGLFSVSERGVIDFANHTLVRLLGLSSRQDVQGRSLSDFLPGADIDALRDEAAELGESISIECDVVHADGTRIPVEVATSRIYVYGDRGQVFRVRDIRPFRRANREARLLRTIFDQAPIGVAVLRLDSEILYANDAYLEMTAFAREDLVGKRLLDLTRSDESHEILLSVQSALARGETVSCPKMDWHRFGTKPGYVDIRSFTIHPPGEDAPRWVTFVRDVTSVVELEREVSRAERIDSLGKLAGGIAHDFNNLLTVIMGQVDILAEDLGADHWGHEYLATIMDACERSATLTSKVLDFSRKQTLRPAVFLADEAIRGLVPLLRQLVPERIALDLAIAPDDEPRVRCDPSRFEQIILNLVANARDAIEDTGTITLRLRTHPRGGEDDRRSLGEVEIEVEDDGTGMSKEVQDRIFDPFFTTKPVGEGTGLGLSTIHGIVHQSGGRIEVSSRPGHGTTLRVFLPGTDAELTRPVIEPRRVHTIEGRRRTVLVVEDNAAVRALVTRTLERLGFEVVAAQDGHEAQAWIDDRERDFEALISDIVMPGLSGVEVARLFRARFARGRIVLMSGYAEDEIGPIERLPSDIRFVQKPITAKILGEALA